MDRLTEASTSFPLAAGTAQRLGAVVSLASRLLQNGYVDSGVAIPIGDHIVSVERLMLRQC